MRKTATALFILTAMACAPAAYAQMGPGGHHGMGDPDKGGPMFQEYDANGDGIVTKAEFEAKTAANFSEADVHHKGAITFEEFQDYAQKQMEKRRQEMMKRHFDKMDTNHDGKISAEEFKVGTDKMFDWMDANHDGKIDASDRQQMHKRWEHRGKGDMSHPGMPQGDMPQGDMPH